jgi:hypothetical protein
MGRRFLSAASVLIEAVALGVRFRLNGGRLQLKARIKPPDELLERLKAHKPEITEILRREEAANQAAETAPVEVKPAEAPISPPPLAARAPPMSQAPLGISRKLAEALNYAAHYHVQFEVDEAGVLVTQPPRDYKREVQAAERALMSCKEEIAMICQLPERPKRYEDQAWVRAVSDSARLGYRNWRED